MPLRYAPCQLQFIRVLRLTIGFFLISLSLFAQTAATGEEMVFKVVEHPPEFPGGPAALTDYVQKNVKYPPEAQKAGLKGKVYINFIVETDGSLTDIQVMNGLGEGCDEEAVRVIEAMPNWQPGTQSGRAVRVRFRMPVLFGTDYPK